MTWVRSGAQKTEHDGGSDNKVDKLMMTFCDKDNYVVHINNFKYYLGQGMVLKQIHRCISVKQKTWLKSWIDFNTEKRKAAKND